MFALFTGAVLGVAGVSIFSLGAMFNYLVAIFYKRPIRQGMFGKPIFSPPLDRHFWWLGLLGMAGGGLALASLVLGWKSWTASPPAWAGPSSKSCWKKSARGIT